MTTFTAFSITREAVMGIHTDRTFIVRSRGSVYDKAGPGTRLGRVFDSLFAQGWKITGIEEFPNRFTFDFVTGGF